MEDNILKAVTRSDSGKGVARKLRAEDRIPAVFYYGSDKNIPISLEMLDLKMLMKANPNLINLKIEGEEDYECILRDIQRDPVTESILHVDLMGITRGQKLTVTVPIRLEGIPEGVKTSGGILQKGITEIDIECLPKHIPNFIDVDVTALEIGSTVYVGDLDYADFKFFADDSVVLATVVPPTVIKEAVVEDEEIEGEEGVEGEAAEDGEGGEEGDESTEA